MLKRPKPRQCRSTSLDSAGERGSQATRGQACPARRAHERNKLQRAKSTPKSVGCLHVYFVGQPKQVEQGRATRLRHVDHGGEAARGVARVRDAQVDDLEVEATAPRRRVAFPLVAACCLLLVSLARVLSARRHGHGLTAWGGATHLRLPIISHLGSAAQPGVQTMGTRP